MSTKGKIQIAKSAIFKLAEEGKTLVEAAKVLEITLFTLKNLIKTNKIDVKFTVKRSKYELVDDVTESSTKTDEKASTPEVVSSPVPTPSIATVEAPSVAPAHTNVNELPEFLTADQITEEAEEDQNF